MSSLVAATRPTRRDIIRHPWRMLAAVLLVALAVAWLAANIVWSESSSRVLGDVQPRTTAMYHGGECVQSPDSYRYECAGDDVSTDGNEPELLDAALPEGFTAHLWLNSPGVVSLGSRSYFTEIVQAPVEALPEGLDPGTGDLPEPGEIMLPREVAERIGAELGDVVEVQTEIRGDQALAVTVSGFVPGYRSLVGEPTLLSPEEFRSTDESGSRGFGAWQITGSAPFTWENVLVLNTAGFIVRSLDVVGNPPPADQVVPGYQDIHPPGAGTLFFGAETFAFLAFNLMSVLLLLVVIAPVFTIAASRQARTFALMSSQGAAPRHIRWAVLTYGAFAGLVGALLGLLVGVGGAAVWWLIRFPGWPLNTPWGSLAQVATVAAVASVVAAFLPARIAARAALSAGIRGAAPDRMMSWRWWMTLGPALFLLLSTAWLAAGFLLGDASSVARGAFGMWQVVGTLFQLLALVASAPALVWVLSRVVRRVPLSVRLAARDAGRRSLRSVPAVAAVLAVVFVPVTGSVTELAYRTREVEQNMSVYRRDLVIVVPAVFPGSLLDEDEPVAAVEAVRSGLGPAREIDVFGLPAQSGADGWFEVSPTDRQGCSWDPMTGEPIGPDGGDPHTDPEAAEACLDMRRTNSGGALPGTLNAATLVAGPEILDVFTGLDDAALTEAATVLNDSGVLTARGTGTAPVDSVSYSVSEHRYDGLSGQQETTLLRSATLPVHALLPDLFPGEVLSPRAAEVLGLEPVYLGTVFLPAEELDRGTRRRLSETVEGAGSGATVSFPIHPWTSPRTDFLLVAIPGLVVIVMVTLIIALSSPQSRRQFALLDALGADPSLARRASAALAGLLTALGTSAGVFAAHLWSWSSASRTTTDINGVVLEAGLVHYMGIHWWSVLVLVVATPLLTAAVGGLFHRRRGELEYREA